VIVKSICQQLIQSNTGWRGWWHTYITAFVKTKGVKFQRVKEQEKRKEKREIRKEKEKEFYEAAESRLRLI
jgi:hypothetical protein